MDRIMVSGTIDMSSNLVGSTQRDNGEFNLVVPLIHRMKRQIIIFISVAVIAFSGACRSSARSVRENDTSAVLHILLDSAFYNNRLSTAAQLSPSDPLKDTIIIERASILNQYLSKNLPHKLLSEAEMCAYMAKHQLSNLQFIELGEFVKISNGYQTALGTHCMWRGTSRTEPEGILSVSCEREKYCNAVFSMVITKKANSFTGGKYNIIAY